VARTPILRGGLENKLHSYLSRCRIPIKAIRGASHGSQAHGYELTSLFREK